MSMTEYHMERVANEVAAGGDEANLKLAEATAAVERLVKS